jgi:capsular exopolysaccharide synthesis family protein
MDQPGPQVPIARPVAARAVRARNAGNGYDGSDHYDSDRYGYGNGYGYQTQMQGEFARTWHFLISKGWIVLVTAALGLGLGYAIIKHAHILYAATATVQAEQDQPNILRMQMVQLRDPQAVDYLQTVAQSLNSRPLFERVADTCKLWDDPDFTNGLFVASPLLYKTNQAPRFSSSTNETPARTIVIDALDRMVKVRLRRGTRLIDITATHPLPAYTAMIANAIVNAYINDNAEREDTSIGLATKSLSKQAERVRKKLEQSENALQTYVEQHKASSLNQQQNTVVDKLKELSTRATEAKSLRLKVETEYAQVEKLGPNDLPTLLTVPSVAKDQTVLVLQLNLAKAENDFIGLCQRYKAKHPKYIQARTQINGLRTDLTNAVLGVVQTLKAGLDGAKASEEALNRAMNEQEASALDLSKLSIQYSVLSREVESDRALYDEVLKGTQEASITKETQQSGIVRVIQQAYLPEAPVWPKKMAIMASSGLAGILFGFVLLMGLRVTDTSIKTVDDAETMLGFSVLSAVPRAGSVKGDKDALIVASKPKSETAEAFRTLRASIAILGNDRRVFLFTSALPGEGKSFSSLNYAASLAQLGLKTLIIDADLRKPTIELALLGEETHAPGVADYQSGQKKLQEVVRQTNLENLYFISAGSIVTSPAELLAKDGLERLIKDALQHYDRLIIDSAPINAVGDTLLLVKSVHSVCLVVKAASTSSRYVLRCVQLLQSAKAPLTGVLLNQMPRHRSLSYGAYYDYHYHGKYGKEGVYGARVA